MDAPVKKVIATAILNVLMNEVDEEQKLLAENTKSSVNWLNILNIPRDYVHIDYGMYFIGDVVSQYDRFTFREHFRMFPSTVNVSIRINTFQKHCNA